MMPEICLVLYLSFYQIPPEDLSGHEQLEAGTDTHYECNAFNTMASCEDVLIEGDEWTYGDEDFFLRE